MIDYLDGGPSRELPATLEYVGGPRRGRREQIAGLPAAAIALAGGEYRRSIRCADDGALRYVWKADRGARRPGD